MKKRISKRLRYDAALGCQAAASTDWNRNDGFDFGDYQSIFQFFWSKDALDLAESARAHVAKQRPAYGGGWNDNASAPWAEAESLLRTGWTP